MYYPPPPRQPLIKPETKQFFGKLFVSLVIIGSLFALILVGINGLSTALESTSNQRADAAIVKQIAGLDQNKPLDQQISELQNLIAKLKGEVQIKEAMAQYPNAKTVVWCQEESQNMGAWTHIGWQLQRWLDRQVWYAGRNASASTAVGAKAVHDREQAALLKDAFTIG